MFAPITRSMTFTLGLCSAALCPDLLAETDSDQEPGSTLELGATDVDRPGIWAAPPKTPSPTPPAP